MINELFSFGAILILASALAFVAVRLKQSTIAGYLLAGAIAGIFFKHSASFEFLSTLGGILLLFFVGLEFSINKIKSFNKKIIYIALIDLAINFPLGIMCGFLFGWNWLEILFIGGIVYVSSSAVISKLLADAGCMSRKESRTVLGVLIIEDIIMVIILAVLSALALQPSVDIKAVSFIVAEALLFCLFFIALEKPIKGLLNIVLNVELSEIFILQVIGLVFFMSFLSRVIGLSEATGAFFIGSALAETVHKQRIKALLEPLAYFSAALFFLSFGLSINILSIDLNMMYMLGVLIAVSIAGKFLVGMAAAPIENLSWREGQNIGVSLFSRGEFSMLLAGLFIAKGASTHGIKEITAVYVFILMIISSILIKHFTKTCKI